MTDRKENILLMREEEEYLKTTHECEEYTEWKFGIGKIYGRCIICGREVFGPEAPA
jgi:hypothetical protein